MGKKYGKSTKYRRDDFVIEGNDKTFLKQRVIVSFRPIKKHKIMPLFNMDKKPFTPAFYIPILYSSIEDQKRQKQFENKIAQLDESCEQILIPRPKLKSFLCCRVCRKPYEDYQEHIQSIQHKKSISQSVFNNLILQMCKKFKEQKRKMMNQNKEFDHQTQDGLSDSGNLRFKSKQKQIIKYD